MPRFFPDSTLVFSGLGYGADGPYLQMNDLEAQKQMRLPVLGRTFTLKKLPQRYCIGPFDLKTYESSACPLMTELPDAATYSDDMCPACREATGFNPAFYNADAISPQQRAYNLTPHFVYMAYFSPAHLKVGISSETRGIERLLEQGARVGHSQALRQRRRGALARGEAVRAGRHLGNDAPGNEEQAAQRAVRCPSRYGLRA